MWLLRMEEDVTDCSRTLELHVYNVVKWDFTVTGRRGSTSEPMDICFGRLQATSEGTGLGQGQDISVVLTKVDKGSKLGNYGAGLSI